MATLGSERFTYDVSGDDWGNLPEGWSYKEVTAVAVNSKDEVYAADVTGVMIVTYHDPDAILDTVAEAGADDTAYQVHTEAVPKPGTEIVLVVRPRASEGDKEKE